MKYNKLFDLTGKVAVITGSTKGIGKAIAEAMAAAGAWVVISSRKEDACRRVAAEITQAGGEAVPLPCNVSHRDQLQGLVDGAIGHWGRIDVLVCNAAVNPYFGPMAEIPDEAYDKTMDTNVKSVLWLCNMAIPAMAERGDGSVIVVSSIAGLKGHGKLGIYGLSKAANLQLVRNLAVEWGRHNVRVNCLAPGLVRTDMARALWEDAEAHAQAVEAYPLGRLGEPQDIAGAAVFLASEAARFVTGHTLVVDGGATIMSGRYT